MIPLFSYISGRRVIKTTDTMKIIITRKGWFRQRYTFHILTSNDVLIATSIDYKDLYDLKRAINFIKNEIGAANIFHDPC